LNGQRGFFRGIRVATCTIEKLGDVRRDRYITGQIDGAMGGKGQP
jgi:hypothetical protein